MTKSERYDIIHKLSEREGSDRSLKIEQQEIKYKANRKDIRRTTETRKFLYRKRRKTLNKKTANQKALNRGSDTGKTVRLYKNLESLILAQDERWRRA